MRTATLTALAGTLLAAIAHNANAGPAQPSIVQAISADSTMTTIGRGGQLPGVNPDCFVTTLDSYLLGLPFENLGSRGFSADVARAAQNDCQLCGSPTIQSEQALDISANINQLQNLPNLIASVMFNAQLPQQLGCSPRSSWEFTAHGSAVLRFRVLDWWRFGVSTFPGSQMQAFYPTEPFIQELNAHNVAELFGPIVEGFEADRQYRRAVSITLDGVTEDTSETRFSFAYPPGVYELRYTSDTQFVPGDQLIPLSVRRSDFYAAIQWNIEPTTAPPAFPAGYSADLDADGDFDIDDMLAWLANPVETNNDGDLDTDPYGTDARTLALFYNATEQLEDDCNGNRFPDAYDIAVGLALGGDDDLNNDTIPDRCQLVPCPADLDGSGTIDLGDLNRVLASFGIDDGGDANGDGLTHLDDLNIILSNFGQPCPNKG